MATPSTVPRGRRDRLSHIRRQSNLEASSELLKDVSLRENDDEEERNCRRQMRVLDDQEKNLNSPSTPSGRRLVLGTALSGLSNEELSEHYKECVRLSTENKITKKNAFQLHLIDYMADTIKKSGGDMNFQVASCALDASAKIYGYRVDALEADTCKLASDLGRTHKNAEENDSQVLSQDNFDNKRKRKVKKSAKVEQNLRNITLDKIDRHFDSDSFRGQMSSGFHEQGVAGLFVFNLPFSDDRCRIELDSSLKPPSLDGSRMLDRDNNVNISSFKSLFKDIINQKLSIDKTFHNFDFKHMDMEEISFKDNLAANNLLPASQNNPEAFMFNEEEIVDPEDDNNGFDLADPDELDEDQIEITVAGAGANAADKGRLHPNLRLENINDTIGFLTAKPSEYSYYDPKLMSAWAGPNHWRFLPFNRRPTNEVPKMRKKQDKIHPMIDFDVKPIELTHTETKNNLTKTALQRWSKEKNELPFDHHYNIENLGKSMLNPSLWIRSLKKVPQPIEADAGDVGYNYDNPADKSNYCGTDGDNSDCDDQRPSSSPDIFGGFQQNQEMEFSFTQGQGETQNQAVPFTGENLVQQPFKIDKPFLAYEKTAKKIDAKKIKRAMWNILSNCDQEEELKTMTGSVTFSHLYSEIPKHISETAAKNMSIPIALVTFLHLCNEKVLHLTPEDMSDFKIQQG